MPLQPPQWTVPPHPSLTYPHCGAFGLLQVMGWHAGPQVPFERHVPVEHAPQSIVVPLHALWIVPHVTPWAMHSSGVTTAQTLA